MALKLILSACFFACCAGTSFAETRKEIAERVFVTVQRVQNSVAGQALAQASTRIAAGNDALSNLMRARQDTADVLAKRLKRIPVLADAKGATAEARLATAQAEIRELRALVATLDNRLNAQFPSFLELTVPAPLKIAEIQALLDPDEALMVTFGDTEYTYLWAISKTEFDWHQAKIGSETLTSMVKQLRQNLSGTGEIRSGKSLKKKKISTGPKPFGYETSRRIYRNLFKPLEHVFSNTNHLMLVFDGPLTSLPPAVLITDESDTLPATTQQLRQTQWLIRSHALTTLPSVAALRALRSIPERPPATQSASFVGFGDPLLGYRLNEPDAPASADTRIATRGVYQNVVEVAQLAPLPNTSRELHRLAATMGSESSAIYLAADATETTVKTTDLRHANVIAFATHGLLANGLPGLNEPALVFTPPDTPTAIDDALLTASEAASLKLSADLVILSACDTAGSDGTPGAEGLSGLARAFIYAGARSILVSHWPVDDFAASVLTTGMLDRMYADTPKGRAQALRASMLDLMENTSQDRFAHPSLWAPFVVVGEGGSINR